MADQMFNFASGKITVAPSPVTTGTTFSMSNADAANFADPASGGNYNLTLWAANQNPLSSNSEVATITAKGAADSGGTGNTQFTFTRLQEQNFPANMTARSIQIGDWVAQNVTKKTITDRVAKSGDTMTGALQFSGTTNPGVILNPLTTTQVNALASPVNGNLVYNSTLVKVEKYENGQWVEVSKAPATKIVAWQGSRIAADYYCDGAADDVELNLALTAAAGGSVYVVGGVGGHIYDITALVSIPSNTKFFSDKTAVLKASASYVGTASMLNNSDITGGNTNITVSDILIDGNQANRTGKVIQDTNGHNLMLRNCTYSRITGVVSYNGIVSCIALGRQSNNCVIEGCIAYNSWDHNILLLGNSAGSLTCNQNIVRGNTSYGAGQGAGQGVGIEIAQLCSNNVIAHNVSYNNAEGGIHLFYQSNKNTVTGNSVYNNNSITGGGAIALVDQSDYNVITNNIIDTTGSAGINATIFSLSYGSKNSIIKDNIIKNCAWNGIRGTTSGDLSGCIIEGNTIDTCGQGGSGNELTAIYALSMTTTSISNNRITNAYERSIRLDSPARVKINNNYIGSGGAGGGTSNHAIFMDTGSSITDCEISGNIIDSIPGKGIIIGHNALRMVITNNVIKSMSGGNSGIELNGITYSTIGNNSCVSNSAYGILLKNDSNSVASQHNTIFGNTCTLNTSGGIVEQGSADYNTYVANNSAANTANDYTLIGANNKVGYNFGLATQSGFTATSAITLAAGVATAGGAPLYLTSGTNLTTPAAGALEFDGTSLYFTPSASRKTISFADMSNLVPAASFSMNSQKITNLLDPTSAQDAATKAYVDAVAQGLSVKPSAVIATTTGLPTYTYLSGVITMTSTGTVTIDGYTLALNDVILVKNETSTNAPYNGLYIVTTAGAMGVANILTRHTSMDSSTEFSGGFVFVESGTANAAAGFVCTNTGSVTVGTTNISFTQFSGAGEITSGAGLTKTGNTIDVIGTTNRITVNADSVDISSSYVGQSSITTLGTIATGVWNGTVIDHTYLSGIVQADVGGLTTASTPTFAGINLGTSALSTVGNISVDGSAARDITVARTTSTTGANLIIQAGGAVSGGSNTAGGSLILKAGISTGNSSSAVQFAVAGGGGSGTSDSNPVTLATLLTRSATLPIFSLGTTGNTTTGLPSVSSNIFAITGAGAGGLVAYRNTTSNTAGNNMTIQASAATSGATDKAGGFLIIAPGVSTGTGIGGVVKIQGLSRASSTATSDNTLTDRALMGVTINIADAGTSLFDVALSTLQMAGGAIIWTIEASDGTDMQALSGITTFSAVNKGGSYTTTITNATGNDAKAVSAGTLTTAWSIVTGTNKVTVKLTPTGSLTETTYRVNYSVLINCPQAVTLL